MAGFGWKTFLRCKAKVSTLSSSLRTQLPDEFLIGVTVSIGELRFGWSLHRGCFVLVGESFLMYRSCAFSASCFRARFCVRVASLTRFFDDGDPLVCQARHRLLFSRTSRSICRFVLKWLVCTSLPCGVEIMAASTNTFSRASVEQSMSASMLKWGLNLMCELTYFLYFNQLVLCDVSPRGWSVVFVIWRRVFSTGEWSDDKSESALALIILRGMFFVTAKSIRYRIFLGSVGQYVGLPGET